MRTRPGWTPGTAPSTLITWDPLREDVDRVWGSLASAPPATALVDPEGEFLRLNLAFVELTGHSEAELRALGFTALLHPDDRDADAEYLQRLLDGELAAYQIPQRCRRADGEVVWVLASAWLTTDADGRPAHTDLEGRPRYVVRQLAELGLGGQAAEQVAGRAARDPLTGLPSGSASTRPTGCWSRSPGACAACCAPATRSAASAATSSPCSARTCATAATRCAWPNGSPRGWTPRSRSAARSSPSTPASASHSPGRTAAVQGTCCATPRPRCTAPSGRRAPATSCTTRPCGRA